MQCPGEDGGLDAAGSVPAAELYRQPFRIVRPQCPTAPLVFAVPHAGRLYPDDFLAGCMNQLVREGKAQGIDFRTAAGRAKYEKMKQHLREVGQQ